MAGPAGRPGRGWPGGRRPGDDGPPLRPAGVEPGRRRGPGDEAFGRGPAPAGRDPRRQHPRRPAGGAAEALRRLHDHPGHGRPPAPVPGRVRPHRGPAADDRPGRPDRATPLAVGLRPLRRADDLLPVAAQGAPRALNAAHCGRPVEAPRRATTSHRTVFMHCALQSIHVGAHPDP
ncbi:hypothetical protein [Ornithinimicrobium kibberense]|uniref:hypothetical protein n=1 Tax=Ornithinimicrobium kibberense TaxID=282060 RepID=UPI0036151ACC